MMKRAFQMFFFFLFTFWHVAVLISCAKMNDECIHHSGLRSRLLPGPGGNGKTIACPSTQLPCAQSRGDGHPEQFAQAAAKSALRLFLGRGGRADREEGGGKGDKGEGERRRGEMQFAAHSRTCTRWLPVSATTMRPSLSMAIPP